MEHQLSPGYLAMEFGLCAAIHVIFGVFNVEPALAGISMAIKTAMGAPAI